MREKKNGPLSKRVPLESQGGVGEEVADDAELD